MNPTADEVRKQISYCPHTGTLSWIVSRSGVTAGSVCGWKENTGYMRIKISGRTYQAHRVAWLLMTGEWPQGEVDHINHDRIDNRWINLRAVSKKENTRNQKANRTSKSGIVGVYEIRSKWVAQIRVDGRLLHLGTFGSIDAATAARTAVAAQHGFHPNHGK